MGKLKWREKKTYVQVGLEKKVSVQGFEICNVEGSLKGGKKKKKG